MTTATITVPFASASPAEIREVLLPEELPGFEEQYREALRVAAETYNLDKLDAVLRTWRRIAWMTDSDPEAHRQMLARVEYTQRTGERPPGWRQRRKSGHCCGNGASNVGVLGWFLRTRQRREP